VQQWSAVFERYTEPAKRAIFYARAVALIDNAPAIDAIHLLWGLLWPDKSRAQVLFHLRERLPQYLRRPRRSLLTARQDLLLTIDAKRILARTAMEADAMGDAWVDTDHLLLGILAEPGCLAAQHLVKAGITLQNARPVVMENRSSRPDYGPVIPLGQSQSPLDWLKSKWRQMKRFWRT
jgi:ATP-dependent Clp protease ATP-binding subunit ClpA